MTSTCQKCGKVIQNEKIARVSFTLMPYHCEPACLQDMVNDPAVHLMNGEVCGDKISGEKKE